MSCFIFFSEEKENKVQTKLNSYDIIFNCILRNCRWAENTLSVQFIYFFFFSSFSKSVRKFLISVIVQITLNGIIAMQMLTFVIKKQFINFKLAPKITLFVTIWMFRTVEHKLRIMASCSKYFFFLLSLFCVRLV